LGKTVKKKTYRKTYNFTTEISLFAANFVLGYTNKVKDYLTVIAIIITVLCKLDRSF